MNQIEPSDLTTASFGLLRRLPFQNAVVAAESMGLRTVYIGAMRNDPMRVAELLGLPPQAVVVFGLCVGYATEKGEGEVKPRLPQSVVLHTERYDASREEALRAAYDAEMAAFSQKHEMTQDTWTKRVIGRMGKIPAMSGRDKLVSILQSMGFPLK